MQYNTVVSAVMKMLNALIDTAATRDAVSDALLRESTGILLRVLYPIAPHIAHELWRELGFESGQCDLLDAPWPQPDAGALQADTVELVVQVNGKRRGAISVPHDADAGSIESAAVADEAVRRHLTGPVRKIVIVPGKLVNVVV